MKRESVLRAVQVNHVAVLKHVYFIPFTSFFDLKIFICRYRIFVATKDEKWIQFLPSLVIGISEDAAELSYTSFCTPSWLLSYLYPQLL